MGVHRAGRVLSIGLLSTVVGVTGTSCATAPRLLAATGGPSPTSTAAPSGTPVPSATPAAPTAAPTAEATTPAAPTADATTTAPTTAPTPTVPTPAVPTPAVPTATVPTPATATVADPITAGAAQDFTIKHRKIVRLGAAVTLPGITDGEQISVTLKHSRTSGVVDGLDPTMSTGLIAVEFVITNTGTVTYSDAPDNCANVIVGTGKRIHIEIDGSTLTPQMPTEIKLAPKQSVTGWLTFRLSAGQTLAAVQFVADSGFSDTAADWKIG